VRVVLAMLKQHSQNATGGEDERSERPTELAKDQAKIWKRILAAFKSGGAPCSLRPGAKATQVDWREGRESRYPLQV